MKTKYDPFIDLDKCSIDFYLAYLEGHLDIWKTQAPYSQETLDRAMETLIKKGFMKTKIRVKSWAR